MSHEEAGGDVRWFSYAEAARLLGVAPDSLRRRAMRSGWRRQLGNDGRALVAVPVDVLGEVTGETGQGRASEADVLGDVTGKLREALARHEATAAGLREQLAAVTLEVAAARQEAREAQERRQAAEVARATAEARAKALEEAAERRRNSFMGRLLGW